jgi:hypothetical protein
MSVLLERIQLIEEKIAYYETVNARKISKLEKRVNKLQIAMIVNAVILLIALLAI